MARYRFSLDILDKDGIMTANQVREIMDSALSAAKIAVPAEMKRNTKVVKPAGVAGEFHGHSGSDCSNCYRAADDEQYSDVTEHFTPTLTLN